MRTASLLTVSQHVLRRGGVPTRGCIPACNGAGTPPTPREQNDRQVGKHNLHKLRLRAVTRQHSSRMCIARSSDSEGVTLQRPP